MTVYVDTFGARWSCDCPPHNLSARLVDSLVLEPGDQLAKPLPLGAGLHRVLEVLDEELDRVFFIAWREQDVVEGRVRLACLRWGGFRTLPHMAIA
jgi:hypothetical protein